MSLCLPCPSDRVISCKVKLQEGSLQIIQVYAPTTDYDDEEAEKFYEDLENAIEKKCANTVIMGDFNAKIGVKDEDEENEWIGPFGIGTRNERGEKLIDFCTANRLFVTNSFFNNQDQDIGHGNHLEAITRIKLISS
ncbi:hypothetical protein RRG08_000125 [Elysia crispata]|uniref:Endonuclease/exonuclease/phosphatase domain-containing protein n=1 Tax=Elysia crispata TaxID=231223 RepID=A0AAE0YUK2_9GAST|nr:hypothetical protein RRG08_000125 [Elysia crispata]